MTKEGSTKIVNSMTLSAWFLLVLGHDLISRIVKIHSFFEIQLFFTNPLLYYQAKNKQTNDIVIMTKERSTKFINFMTTAA